MGAPKAGEQRARSGAQQEKEDDAIVPDKVQQILPLRRLPVHMVLA